MAVFLKGRFYSDAVRGAAAPERPGDGASRSSAPPLAVGPVVSFLATPVLHLGRRVGNIYLAEKEAREEFTGEDEETLVMFASQAAMVIANARRHREERRAGADLETLINTSPVGVAVFDARTGAPVSFNWEATRIVDSLREPDQSPEQLLGVLTCRRADGREISLLQLSMAELLSAGETVRAEEIVLRVPDGRSVTALLNATPIRQRQSLSNLIEAIPEDDWTPIPYWMDGATDVAETSYTPFQSEPGAALVRLIVRRVKPTLGSQLALLATYSYHGFITDRDGEMLKLEADHRRHAEIENAIRDLKYGVGLNHLPSGRFAANAAWLATQVMAHNLAPWTVRIGLGERTVTTKTLRRRVFALVGRLTRSARRLTLHLPKRWPWEAQFTRALTRLRTLPLPS